MSIDDATPEDWDEVYRKIFYKRDTVARPEVPADKPVESSEDKDPIDKIIEQIGTID